MVPSRRVTMQTVGRLVGHHRMAASADRVLSEAAMVPSDLAVDSLREDVELEALVVVVRLVVSDLAVTAALDHLVVETLVGMAPVDQEAAAIRPTGMAVEDFRLVVTGQRAEEMVVAVAMEDPHHLHHHRLGLAEAVRLQVVMTTIEVVGIQTTMMRW